MRIDSQVARKIDRLQDIQMDRWIDSQIDRLLDRQIARQIDCQIDRLLDRQIARQIQTDRLDRQIYEQLEAVNTLYIMNYYDNVEQFNRLVVHNS